MAIRVLRIMEYEFENEDIAAFHMEAWTNNFSIQRSGFTRDRRDGRGGFRMRSAVMPIADIPWVPVTPEEDTLVSKMPEERKL